MEKRNPFEFHDTDIYVACVGENGGTDNCDIREGFKTSVNIMINAVENGEYEDTLIYPVVYNVRHSIELSLKIIIEKIICEDTRCQVLEDFYKHYKLFITCLLIPVYST